jgi:hypothetical protein
MAALASSPIPGGGAASSSGDGGARCPRSRSVDGRLTVLPTSALLAVLPHPSARSPPMSWRKSPPRRADPAVLAPLSSLAAIPALSRPDRRHPIRVRALQNPIRSPKSHPPRSQPPWKGSPLDQTPRPQSHPNPSRSASVLSMEGESDTPASMEGKSSRSRIILSVPLPVSLLCYLLTLLGFLVISSLRVFARATCYLRLPVRVQRGNADRRDRRSGAYLIVVLFYYSCLGGACKVFGEMHLKSCLVCISSRPTVNSAAYLIVVLGGTCKACLM